MDFDVIFGTNTSERPKSAQHSSSIFMFIVIFVLLKMYENLAFATVVSFGTSFPCGFMENHCFIAVAVRKCMLNTLKQRYVFWMVFRFAKAPPIFFHRFNLHHMKCVHRMHNATRSVFTALKHTRAA